MIIATNRQLLFDCEKRIFFSQYNILLQKCDKQQDNVQIFRMKCELHSRRVNVIDVVPIVHTIQINFQWKRIEKRTNESETTLDNGFSCIYYYSTSILNTYIIYNTCYNTFILQILIVKCFFFKLYKYFIRPSHQSLRFIVIVHFIWLSYEYGVSEKETCEWMKLLVVFTLSYQKLHRREWEKSNQTKQSTERRGK